MRAFCGCVSSLLIRCRRVQPLAGTLRPQRGCPEIDPSQPFAVLVEVGQRKAPAQPLVILLQAAIAHLGETEYTLDDPEGPLHFGAHAGFGAVSALLRFINARLALYA